jgi:hypothetical protein
MLGRKAAGKRRATGRVIANLGCVLINAQIGIPVSRASRRHLLNNRLFAPDPLRDIAASRKLLAISIF